MAKFKKSKILKKKLSSKYKEIAKEREQELKKEKPKVEKPKKQKVVKQNTKRTYSYNESVASKVFDKRIDYYTRSYLASKKQSDEERYKEFNRTPTNKEIQDARDAFLAFTHFKVIKNEGLSTGEAAESLTRTSGFNFNYLDENAAANLQNQLKSFGYKVQKRNIKYEGGQYVIKGGKYDGCTVVMIRDPNYDDSIRFEIQDENGIPLSGNDYEK